MNVIQRAATVGAVTAAVVGGTALVAPQAGAATVAKYNGVCGTGYAVVDSAPVGTAGTVFLTYNPSTGRDCVVTVRARAGV
ncbi:hypothetical protein [Streptomyces resistomycificus]|uniref:hypothetical protein n=1 Tax=Streptomyces resistomycificus TaxID=67356 RepID=UPI000A6D50BB|nr:hypothetical protein [Streptomyces resistomycificus]